MLYSEANLVRLARIVRCLNRPKGRVSMPSSGTFARIGLIAAVAVVVGVSTFGSLLRQVAPRAITIGPAPVAATPAPPPPDRPQSATNPATAEQASPAAPSADAAVSSPTRPSGEPAAAKPAQAPPATSTATASLPSAFPPVQIMTEAGQAASQPAPQAEAAPTAQPAAEKPKRAADNRANKKKRKTRPAP